MKIVFISIRRLRKMCLGVPVMICLGVMLMLVSCYEEQSHERLLPMQGTYNLRDLGGYQAADGRYVKWRRVFRGGDLDSLTESDLQYLARIPVLTVIDFRDSAEVAMLSPDKKPFSLQRSYWFPIKTKNLANFDTLKARNVPLLMMQAYRRMISEGLEDYKEFFGVLQQDTTAPVIFHCVAGKDRVGCAAALFLFSLGVDRQTVIEDYMLSAEYLQGKYVSKVKDCPIMGPLLDTRREYIEAALDEIEHNYGGMENFLVHYLNVDLKRMRLLYTE